MTTAADLILRDAEVHTLADPDEVAAAVAIRDGRIVRIGSSSEVSFLAGVDTRVIDLGGRVVVPGFVDAHTHMAVLGRRERHADLGDASGPADAVARLRGEAGESGSGWVVGFGYDESAWDGATLSRADLDRVSQARPVVAFREDLHAAVVNGVVLDRYGDAMPEADVRVADGDPTGVVVEGALAPIFDALAPDSGEARDLLRAAQRTAHRRGVTGVHDMVRRPAVAAAYRDLDAADELRLRTRLNYWRDHLDAAVAVGLRTNHGTGFLRTGAIKLFADGSIGSHTARLAAPYADADGCGEWATPPDDLAAAVERADAAGFQVAVHAIGDEAIDAVLDAYAAVDAGADARHRIEHAELATDDQIDRMADLGVVASMQPNFHRWAGADGLYDRRLGRERRVRTNRIAAFRDRGVPVAFGSDCMPLDPLLGVDYAANPPAGEGLSVTEALRAYTRGSAYAGFDEDRAGTVAVGSDADLVALDASPWTTPGAIRDVDVALTVVGGDVVFDAR